MVFCQFAKFAFAKFPPRDNSFKKQVGFSVSVLQNHRAPREAAKKFKDDQLSGQCLGIGHFIAVEGNVSDALISSLFAR